MESQIDKRRRIAPESLKTKRARDKLRRQLEEQDLLITDQALAETVDKIHKWISANATQRVAIKKDIRLFDQNQNAANLSKKVQVFAHKINFDMEQVAIAMENLARNPIS